MTGGELEARAVLELVGHLAHQVAAVDEFDGDVVADGRSLQRPAP